MPPACNLAACLGLSGTATCIVSAIGSGDPAALQRCLVNGLAQVCSSSSSTFTRVELNSRSRIYCSKFVDIDADVDGLFDCYRYALAQLACLS